jgi:hypothetical protein
VAARDQFGTGRHRSGEWTSDVSQYEFNYLDHFLEHRYDTYDTISLFFLFCDSNTCVRIYFILLERLIDATNIQLRELEVPPA